MNLSPRQRQIATLVAEGLTGRQIADRLDLAEQTVKNYKREMYRKLGVRNAVEMLKALEAA
jgi:two-component system, NarL family, response regulator DevR